MSVSSVQAYEAAMLANHIADDAYAAGVYAAALAAVAASGVPPIDREVSNGGGSGICDCVAASFTTDIQATVQACLHWARWSVYRAQGEYVKIRPKPF